MALGAALATAKPQAYAVVPGPGLLNSGAALLTAYGMNAPVLAIIGQIPAAAIGKRQGHLHEIRDQAGIIARLVDHYSHIKGPADASAKVAQAIQSMHQGRPGPAAIECAIDVWGKRGPVEAVTSPSPARAPSISYETLPDGRDICLMKGLAPTFLGHDCLNTEHHRPTDGCVWSLGGIHEVPLLRTRPGEGPLGRPPGAATGGRVADGGRRRNDAGWVRGMVSQAHAERYRQAAEEALQQLDWCIGYLHGIRKRKISMRLAKNRAIIRRNLMRESEQPLPSQVTPES